jgi:hypothetical protein
LNAEVFAEIERLGVTQICHLTPYRNLVHIATGDGLISSGALADSERKAFTQQDLERWDGHPDHICCSIEYPNAWYHRQKAGNDELFRTWVVMIINPRHLAEDDTLFCHRNASASGGAYLRRGVEGLRGMYASPVIGAGGRSYERSETHLAPCPTDNQAEALVRRFIPIDDVIAIALPSDDQAAFVYAGLTQIGGNPDRFTFKVVPEFFQPWPLANAISAGTPPEARVWTP